MQTTCSRQQQAISTETEFFCSETALTRAEWQTPLFAEQNRARLLKCDASWRCERVRVRVNGNHGFAPVACALAPYAAWNGLSFTVQAGPYDDTMSLHLEGEADVDLIWLDTSRLTGLDAPALASWLMGRLQTLRAATPNPIICMAWPLSPRALRSLKAAQLAGVQFPDIDSIANDLGDAWLDLRALALSGTRLSSRAGLRIARELACRWIPASLLPPVKAVVVDLDNTLFSGVLAEDYTHGVQLTQGHRELQQALVRLRETGVYLALVSRNEMVDVETLFASRPDFPLRLSHFSALQVSWDDKADALRKVADVLRIDSSAMVYIDDNPGELAEMAAEMPIITVHADSDGALTHNALDHVAGIFRWQRMREDALRAADLHASAARDAMALTARSGHEYLRELRVRLGYSVNRAEHLGRVHELIHKTNQFNLSMRRLNESELASISRHPQSRIVAVSLQDRLSDSGIIGVVIATQTSESLTIEELCLSCRSLGRHLEDTIAGHALRILAQEFAVDRVTFRVRVGPRNAPARRWLAKYLGLGVAEVLSDVTADASWLIGKPVEDLVTVHLE